MRFEAGIGSRFDRDPGNGVVHGMAAARCRAGVIAPADMVGICPDREFGPDDVKSPVRDNGSPALSVLLVFRRTIGPNGRLSGPRWQRRVQLGKRFQPS